MTAIANATRITSEDGYTLQGIYVIGKGSFERERLLEGWSLWKRRRRAGNRTLTTVKYSLSWLKSSWFLIRRICSERAKIGRTARVVSHRINSEQVAGTNISTYVNVCKIFLIRVLRGVTYNTCYPEVNNIPGETGEHSYDFFYLLVLSDD